MDSESDELTEEEDVKARQKQKDWDEFDRENQGVDSRDKVKHVERNDELYVMRMMLMAGQLE